MVLFQKIKNLENIRGHFDGPGHFTVKREDLLVKCWLFTEWRDYFNEPIKMKEYDKLFGRLSDGKWKFKQ